MAHLSATWLWLVTACSDQPPHDPAEWFPGGDTTNTMLLGSNSFLRPAQNLSSEHELQFYSGNSFFNQSWVEAPASTEARDGLGPLFNARTCSGCHFRDGKAEQLEPWAEAVRPERVATSREWEHMGPGP